MGKILALCISEKKGTLKTEINEANFIEDFGIENDAHAGKWHRQVSLLEFNKIDEFRKKGANVDFGAFGENIVLEGIELHTLPIGQLIKIGDVLLEVTQIGKKCHDKCQIYYQVGECIMPKNGIFTKVLKGGKVKVGDECSLVKSDKMVINL
ncbi:MAG: MOSC domain-containing protein [Clostridiales bacterium]|uniref:MOSC domain-containing protein n=1 Tax=Terrisporobacter sp. TaxID=1965305 RepID=UPI002A4A5530|nr:MOSC domain-containing protein [Terrisporobacter sp.]MCI6459613.1 MOSC domain-containing protein [Clostridium sp.]MDD5878806.1 MOSC domain-containing protein [Clostridiales bacterium]MCI7204771.1 MOSC domain-containing protein [Clostridium sp.]MDD7755657.1 MOSC domain-containing protein [Clostridiales bacterium]MDY4135201.1 MOSC domain-containing protein [Terrisporobacter sp.]